MRVDMDDGCEAWSRRKYGFLSGYSECFVHRGNARRNSLLWDGKRVGWGGMMNHYQPLTPPWPYQSRVSNRVLLRLMVLDLM